MKTGIYTNGGASCKVSYCQAISPHLRGGLLEITRLETKEIDRNKGHASALIENVCNNADINRKILLIMPDPDGLVMGKDELTRWYIRRFGFELLQEQPVRLLVRRWQNQKILSLKQRSVSSGLNPSMELHDS